MTAQNTAGTDGPHIERATVEQGAGARQGESGVQQIAAERAKQLARWTVAHDLREHSSRHSLLEAAQQLLTAVQDGLSRTPGGVADFGLVEQHQDPIRRLAIAGALIAAEIDRRQLAELAHVILESERAAEQPAAAPSGRPFWPVGTSDEKAAPDAPRPYWIIEASHGSWSSGLLISLPYELGEWEWMPPPRATRFATREEAERVLAGLRPRPRLVPVTVDGVTRRKVTADYEFRVAEHIDLPAEADKESVEADPLWEAIDDYVRACGGDIGTATVDMWRMVAVDGIKDALNERLKAALTGVPESAALRLYRVQFDDFDSYVVATSMTAAIQRWKDSDPGCDDEPHHCDLIPTPSGLFLPGVWS